MKELDEKVKRHRTLMRIAGVIVMASVLVVLSGCQTQAIADEDVETPLTKEQIIENLGSKLVTTRADDQTEANKTYQAALANADYTLAQPYIKVNPYETSPLTALVIFTTAEKAKVTYTVVGKSTGTSITNTVNGGYQTQHQVPVVGLYAGNNTVKVTVETASGTTTTQKLAITTSTTLPKYIKSTKITVTKNDKKKMAIGDNQLTFLVRTTKESFAVDADGAVRWYSTYYVQHMLQPISNGHLLMLTKEDQDGDTYNDLLETDYLGRIYQEYTFDTKTGNSEQAGDDKTVIHHDIIELPNHDLLATVSDGSKYVEDTMAVISHTTGKVKQIIDLKRILPETMYQEYQESDAGTVDWFHQNAVWYDKNDQSILISGRNQDMILKMDLKTTKLKWIYSGKQKSTWPTKYQQFLLSPTKGTTVLGGQHGINLLEDEQGDPSSEDILLYNNNINVTNGDKDTSGKYSEGVQYHIDTDKMTITETWSYGKSLGKANFTPAIGYTQKLSNGNYLIDFGWKNDATESNIIEVDGQKQVYNLTVSNPSAKAYVYRAYRLATYDENYLFDVTQ